MGRLTYYNAETRECHISLDATMPEVIIGRSADCNVSVNMASISRRHASVTFDVATGVCTVSDLGSSNGVVVNGTRIQNHVLRDRDDIVLGGFRLTFFDDQQAAGQPAQPPPAGQHGPRSQATFAMAGLQDEDPRIQQSVVPPPMAQAPPPMAQAPPPMAQAALPMAQAAPPMSPAQVPYPPGAPPQPDAAQRIGILEANAPSQEVLEQLQARVTQLEAENGNLRLGLETATRERDELKTLGGTGDPQQLERLRRDVVAAQAQLREVDSALTRALELLEQLTGGVTI